MKGEPGNSGNVVRLVDSTRKLLIVITICIHVHVHTVEHLLLIKCYLEGEEHGGFPTHYSQISHLPLYLSLWLLVPAGLSSQFLPYFLIQSALK